MKRGFLLVAWLAVGLSFGGGSVIVADHIFTGKPDQLARVH